MRVLSFGLLIAPLWVAGAYADTLLGTAGNFAVLGGSTVTNTGPSVINGNLGVSPGTAVTGFPPGVVTPPATIYQGGAVPLQAESDLTTAYNTLFGLSSTTNLTGVNLGGQILNSGVYKFNSSAQLTGTLTLNAQGMANQFWVFQINSALTTATSSAVNIINAGANEGVFWVIGSSATLGTGTSFEGNVVALTSISLDTGATIACGSALARNGAVTLDDNDVNTGCSTSAAGLSGFVSNNSGGLSPTGGGGGNPVPEPHDLIVPLGFCIVGLALQARRKRARAGSSKDLAAI